MTFITNITYRESSKIDSYSDEVKITGAGDFSIVFRTEIGDFMFYGETNFWHTEVALVEEHTADNVYGVLHNELTQLKEKFPDMCDWSIFDKFEEFDFTEKKSALDALKVMHKVFNEVPEVAITILMNTSHRIGGSHPGLGWLDTGQNVTAFEVPSFNNRSVFFFECEPITWEGITYTQISQPIETDDPQFYYVFLATKYGSGITTLIRLHTDFKEDDVISLPRKVNRLDQ